MNQIIEQFESRRLFSAVLDAGILTVNGTSRDNVMRVWNSVKSPKQLVVQDGTQEFSFARKNIRLIRINGGRGNDNIQALVVNGAITLPLSINGGAGDDFMVGGAGADSFVGETGNDSVTGGRGEDLVDYRYVDQPVALQQGSKLYGVIATLSGDGVHPQIAFEPGGFEDHFASVEGVIGTNFRDVITGNGAANTLIGAGGPDRLSALGGDDFIDGGKGADFISAGSGNDTIIGDQGNDTMNGDSDDDELRGGFGDDQLFGGDGSDTFSSAEKDSGEVEDFAEGVDALV